MPTEQYFGMRLTTERRNLLKRIAANTGATYDDTSFANLRRTEAEPYIAAICKALGLDPGNWGGMTSAVDFALQSTLVLVTGGETVEVKEGETALMLALRWMAEWVEQRQDG